MRYRSGRPVTTADVDEYWLPGPDCSAFGYGYPVNSDGSFKLSNLVPRIYQPAASTFINRLYVVAWPNGIQRYSIMVHEGETVSGVVFVFPDPVYFPFLMNQRSVPVFPP